MHDLELLREPFDANGRLRELEAERAVLALHPAGAQSELDASAGYMVRRRDRVREQSRRAEGDGGDERPEPEGGRARGEGGDRRPGIVRDAVELVALRDVVVGAEERLDAVLLAGRRQRAPVAPGDVLLPLDHERELHGASLSPPRRTSPSGHVRYQVPDVAALDVSGRAIPAANLTDSQREQTGPDGHVRNQVPDVSEGEVSASDVRGG